MLAVLEDLLQPANVLALGVIHALLGGTVCRTEEPAEAESMSRHAAVPHMVVMGRNADRGHTMDLANSKGRGYETILHVCYLEGRVDVSPFRYEGAADVVLVAPEVFDGGRDVPPRGIVNRAVSAVFILAGSDDHNRATPCLDLQWLGEGGDGAVDLIVGYQVAGLGVRNQQEVMIRGQASRSPNKDLNRGLAVGKDAKCVEALVLDDENRCLRVVVDPDELANVVCDGKEHGVAGEARLLVLPGFVPEGPLPTELLMDILRALEQNHAREVVVQPERLNTGLAALDGTPLSAGAVGAA